MSDEGDVVKSNATFNYRTTDENTFIETSNRELNCTNVKISQLTKILPSKNITPTDDNLVNNGYNPFKFMQGQVVYVIENNQVKTSIFSKQKILSAAEFKYVEQPDNVGLQNFFCRKYQFYKVLLDTQSNKYYYRFQKTFLNPNVMTGNSSKRLDILVDEVTVDTNIKRYTFFVDPVPVVMKAEKTKLVSSSAAVDKLPPAADAPESAGQGETNPENQGNHFNGGRRTRKRRSRRNKSRKSRRPRKSRKSRR